MMSLAMVFHRWYWVIVMILCLICGCKNQAFVEGTSTTVGLYVPTSEGLIGLQFLEYLNGVKVRVATNNAFAVERQYCATNSYFGIISTVEHSKTKVEVKK